MKNLDLETFEIHSTPLEVYKCAKRCTYKDKRAKIANKIKKKTDKLLHFETYQSNKIIQKKGWPNVSKMKICKI